MPYHAIPRRSRGQAEWPPSGQGAPAEAARRSRGNSRERNNLVQGSLFCPVAYAPGDASIRNPSIEGLRRTLKNCIHISEAAFQRPARGVLTGGVSLPVTPRAALTCPKPKSGRSGSLQRCSSRSAPSGRRAGSGAPRVREIRRLTPAGAASRSATSERLRRTPPGERDRREFKGGQQGGDKLFRSVRFRE